MKRAKFLIFIAILISTIFIIPVKSIGDVKNNYIEDSIEREYVFSNVRIGESIPLNNESDKKVNVSPKEIKEDLTLKDSSYNLEYEFKNIEKYDNYLVYKISYPVFNNNNINEKVYSYIKYLAEDFQGDFSTYKPTSSDDKQTFKLDTDIEIFKENILFIKFTVERNYNTYPNPIKFYETYIIDIDENNKIEIKDILNSGYEDLFYIESKEYFFNTYGLNITKKSENYNDIKPDKENYKNIFIKGDIVEIFIYDYKKQEEAILKINIDKLLPYLKKQYIETTTETTTIEITTTQTTTQIETKTETSIETTTEYINSTTIQQNDEKFTPNSTENKASTKRTIDKNKPMIALTFDDGPNSAVTNKILDVLEENNSVATFFIVSRRMEKDAETLKRMDSLDCQIGNHTANHKDLTKISVEQIKSEVDIVNNKLEEIIGKEASMVRVPYGATNQKVKDTIQYPIIMWNVDTKDWKSRNAEAIEEQVLGKVKDGDIVLMHDLYKETAEACQVIIPKLIEEGFQLVTVQELLEYKEIEIKDGQTYFNGNNK